MSEYVLGEIFSFDKRAIEKQNALLKKEGISRDKNLDYSVGMFDGHYKMVATGSCYKNTLRCMAVDSEYQGEGLLNEIVSHLIDYQYHRGNLELFLYTKCDTAKIFEDLSFYEIARVEGKVVFMENRRNGFKNYLKNISKKKVEASKVAVVVINANPFTLGHEYLLERASKENDIVHVFVVSEDESLIPFHVRFKLVKEGTSHLKNIIYHATGNYIISNGTFPSYFLKDHETVILSQAKLDIEIFKRIAQVLGINRRYVGEEPFSEVTGIYNKVMEEDLEGSGVQCVIIERKETNEGVISASKVRSLIQQGNIEGIKDMVPKSTYRYFTSGDSEVVVTKIKGAKNVVHY